MQEITAGRGADVAFEVVGSTPAVSSAIDGLKAADNIIDYMKSDQQKDSNYR